MAAKLAEFDRRAEEIIVGFVAGVEALPPPPVIYHYTDDVGLRGILESGTLWLSDIFNLNDPSELSHGFSHAIGILNAMAETGPLESKVFARQFAAFLDQGGIRAVAHYFVCSFSAAGDDLGQWRAYADNGRGYVLGFDAKALEDSYTKDGDVPIPNNSTFPITYSDAKLAEIHKQLVEVAFPLISLPRGKALSREQLHTYMGELSVTLTMHALRAALFFKHQAYSNEREYRFLQIHRADLPAPDVKFRRRPYSLIRYREFDWKKSGALRQIIVGPSGDPPKAQQYAHDCVSAFYPAPVEISQSKIPYRAG